MKPYHLYIHPEAWREIKTLPGYIKQRIRKAIADLSKNPRRHNSKQLRVSHSQIEARRLRLDRWRIIYLVDDTEKMVHVLAVRKRPPYDYGDLYQMITKAMDE